MLVKPKDISKYPNYPRGVLKTVFHPSFCESKQVVGKSSFMKMLALCNGLNAELMRGSGYLFLMVICSD